MDLIKIAEESLATGKEKTLPSFKSGDTVTISYKIVEGTDYGVDVFAVGFRKEDTALRDKFNQILIDMKKDGSADQIFIKWFGTASEINKDDVK